MPYSSVVCSRRVVRRQCAFSVVAVVDAEDGVGVADVDGEEQGHGSGSVAERRRPSPRGPRRRAGATSVPSSRSRTSAPLSSHVDARPRRTSSPDLASTWRPHQGSARARHAAMHLAAPARGEAMIPDAHSRQDRGRDRPPTSGAAPKSARHAAPARASASRPSGTRGHVHPDADHRRLEGAARGRGLDQDARRPCGPPTRTSFGHLSAGSTPGAAIASATARPASSGSRPQRRRIARAAAPAPRGGGCPAARPTRGRGGRGPRSARRRARPSTPARPRARAP